jgi:hypothetical protein
VKTNDNVVVHYSSAKEHNPSISNVNGQNFTQLTKFTNCTSDADDFDDIWMYEGEWFDDQIHGIGTAWFYSGSVYCGQFSNGKMHGNGRLVKADSTKINGEWFNGLLHGLAVTYFADGSVFHGEYDHGVVMNNTSHSLKLAALRIMESKVQNLMVQVCEAEKRIEAEKLCKLCQENVINALFMDCAHMCVCFECGQFQPECLVCDNPIRKVVHVFYADC